MFITATIAFLMSGASALPSSVIKGDSSVTTETFTSEEMRLWALGDLRTPLKWNARYRVVGKLYGIRANEQGLPELRLYNIGAVLDRGVDLTTVAALNPGDYVSVVCDLSHELGPKRPPMLKHCSDLRAIPVVSSYDYWREYERNPFRADALYKDKDVVVHGKVRLTGKLTYGEDYVSLNADKDGMADVVAVIYTTSIKLIPKYAKLGRETALYCHAGKRWNLAGSVGFDGCRFLDEQDYGAPTWPDLPELNAPTGEPQ